jgi:hypothetical protein
MTGRGPYPVTQLGDTLVFCGIVAPKLPQNFFGLIQIEQLILFILEQIQLFGFRVIDRVHRFFV